MRKITTNPFFVRLFGLGLGIGLGIAGMLFVLPGQTFATNPYDKPLQGLQAALALYHKNIDALFNARMKLLMGGKGDQTVYMTTDDSGTEVPDATQCTDQNVTTFCLSMAALDQFEDFEVAMATRAKRFWNEEDAENLTSTTITDIALTQALRARAITDEMTVAEIALDRALAAYNELRIAYPIHQQYEQVIIDLTKYRDALAGVRDEIEIYPSKLLDATTPSCG